MPSIGRLPCVDSGGPRIGLLLAGASSYPSHAAFVDGIRSIGGIGGQKVEIAARFGEGRTERLPGLAAELVALRPDVMAVIGAVSFFAAREVAADIPLVFAIVLDPVEAGLVGDADRPGGTVTGATSYDPGQAARQVQLLKQTMPGLSRLAILGDAGVPRLLAERARVAALSEGIQCDIRLLSETYDTVSAIADFRRGGATALLVLEVPRTSTRGSMIAELAHESVLPTMFGRDLAGSGRCWPTEQASQRQPGDLRGSSIAYCRVRSLVICPSSTNKLELIVNLKIAGDLAVVVPPEVLAQANEVIE